jgi:hypothetical protein
MATEMIEKALKNEDMTKTVLSIILKHVRVFQDVLKTHTDISYVCI